jgi:hypothetical protein
VEIQASGDARDPGRYLYCKAEVHEKPVDVGGGPRWGQGRAEREVRPHMRRMRDSTTRGLKFEDGCTREKA